MTELVRKLVNLNGLLKQKKERRKKFSGPKWIENLVVREIMIWAIVCDLTGIS